MLLTFRQMSEFLNVEPVQLARWQTEVDDFPDPIELTMFSSSLVWDSGQVTDWLVNRFSMQLDQMDRF